MIATRRGLELLVAIAVILGVVLVIDVRRESEPIDHSLAQGLDIDAVTALAWVRAGSPEIQLVREREQWKWVTPVDAIADRSAVANILATLRAARWHRREPASAAGPTHVVLRISTAMPTTGGKPPEYADLPRRTLAIGAPLPGTEQAWIVEGEHALLVDAWVARALAPDPVTLMVRRPLDAVTQAPWVELASDQGALRLEGAPRRLVAPYVALIHADLVVRLHEAMAALEIVALPPATGSPPAMPAVASLRIATPATTVRISDACGGAANVLLSSARVTGCIARTAYLEVLAALGALHAGGQQVIERRLAPIDAATVTLRDGGILDVTRQRIGEHAADPVRIPELLSVLAAPSELGDAPRSDLPSIAAGRGTVTVTDRHGSMITLQLAGGGVVARTGEALALMVTPAAAAILERPASAYRDLTPWSEEPLTVSAIRIDDKSFVRGAVVGEWSPPERSTALETLAAQLAAPRPVGVGPAAFVTLHRVVLVVAQPAGKVVEHRLEIGGKIAAGCPARANATSVVLAATVCDTISTIAR